MKDRLIKILNTLSVLLPFLATVILLIGLWWTWPRVNASPGYKLAASSITFIIFQCVIWGLPMLGRWIADRLPDSVER